ncbi:Asp-tRNA(Asn)/Glu-tRNA(Gln) amidotransferase subunit GatA [Candidatus Parcubacteria bacterium]|nr:MAG: Asp-tRNA(Asn)/Glu-tRNA(Gln) amidotransferase subunit GatA [Candidatus Parcubacteria bacterium]
MSSLPSTLLQASQALQKGEVGPEELTARSLERINARDGEVKAFLEVFDDLDEQIARAKAKLAAPNPSPLAGIPLAIKDNLLWEGKRVSAASRILEGYIAPYTATAVARLIDAGAIIVGRTNMDEFAMGSSTEHSAYQQTRNPHDTSRVPGGSSGGSAAAVADGMVLGALGSDTGGSIRQPAALCGVVGFKPTYGAVSRYGLIAMGSSLDVVGPLAPTVEDAAVIFSAIVGRDPNDATSLTETQLAPKRDPGPVRVGVVREVVEHQGLHRDVRERFDAALQAFTDAGCDIVEVEIPLLREALAMYYIIMPAEASTNLARFDGVRYGPRKEGEGVFGDITATRGLFGAEVKRRILLGTYVLSSGYYDAYYRTARRARGALRQSFAQAFAQVDVIATPTTTASAFRLGEKTADPLAMYLEDIFTVPANIAGIPALSLPMGRDTQGLPLGMQLMAPFGADWPLLATAQFIEGVLQGVS